MKTEYINVRMRAIKAAQVLEKHEFRLVRELDDVSIFEKGKMKYEVDFERGTFLLSVLIGAKTEEFEGGKVLSKEIAREVFNTGEAIQ